MVVHPLGFLLALGAGVAVAAGSVIAGKSGTARRARRPGNA